MLPTAKPWLVSVAPYHSTALLMTYRSFSAIFPKTVPLQVVWPGTWYMSELEFGAFVSRPWVSRGNLSCGLPSSYRSRMQILFQRSSAGLIQCRCTWSGAIPVNSRTYRLPSRPQKTILNLYKEFIFGRLYGKSAEDQKKYDLKITAPRRQLIGQLQTETSSCRMSTNQSLVRLVSGKAGGDCMNTISTRADPWKKCNYYFIVKSTMS